MSVPRRIGYFLALFCLGPFVIVGAAILAAGICFLTWIECLAKATDE